jgi:hypothetical protein
MDQILTIIISGVISVIILIVGKYLEKIINKSKDDAAVGLISADTDLRSGDIVKKYQDIARDQADENLELSSQLKIEKEEKKTLVLSLQQIKVDMESMKIEHREEIKRLEGKFDEERKENEAWKNWALRLSMQLKSWEIEPCPFSPEEAKRNKLSMGEFGPKKVE